MLKSIPATIEQDGTIHLLEQVNIGEAHRAIVTILDQTDESVASDGSGQKREKAAYAAILKETAGMWGGRHGDGLEYVEQLRSEWERK